jgi:enoyl-[acyl-carrier-protein] reductase (NADH)
MLDPEVCVNTAAYLNSDLASAVTDAIIPVDAGHALLPRLNMNPVRPGE